MSQYSNAFDAFHGYLIEAGQRLEEIERTERLAYKPLTAAELAATAQAWAVMAQAVATYIAVAGPALAGQGWSITPRRVGGLEDGESA